MFTGLGNIWWLSGNQSILIQYNWHENFFGLKCQLMFAMVTDELLYSAQI